MQPPKAAQKAHTSEVHGQVRTDQYHWLREKESPEVLEYLKAENAYTEAMMADTKDLQKQLYKEMKGRIKETDVSAPVKIDDYFYYTRTEEGKEYPIYCRKHKSLEASEEILLDHNELALKHEHCTIGVFEVSPDHQLLAYSIDTDGSERYTVRIKDLVTGKLLPDTIQNTSYSFEWFNDNGSFVYTVHDKMMRPHRVFRHTLGEKQEADAELYHEPDERFYVGLDKSKSEKFIFVELGSKVTTEVHTLDADDASAAPVLFEERKQGHEYYVEHHIDTFFVRSNEGGAQNFKLMETPVNETSRKHWKEAIAERDDVMLEGIEVFKNFLCVYEMTEGIVRIRVRDVQNNHEHYISFDEEVYDADSGSNPNFESETLRYVYSSLVTPHTTYDYDMSTKERMLVKQKEVLGGYDPQEYTVERQYATAEDGVEVPITLAYKKGAKLDGTAPCWLYAYGSYGMSIDPGFSTNRVSLLDRGFVFAIVHIRGGGENGRRWYEDGKYLKKKNTFTDYIAAAKKLVELNYTSPEGLVACGRSAGGLLMGAVTNMRPDLFKGIIADVPFVDVINTMLDPSIPLTVIEYEEWGNPNEQEYFDYMLSYSPYDNVTKQNYPNMLVTAGLNDPRVQYWEPAKWVAKLREYKTDENLLLLKTEMVQGHMGASGRYEFLKEVAFEYAFALKILKKRKEI